MNNNFFKNFLGKTGFNSKPINSFEDKEDDEELSFENQKQENGKQKQKDILFSNTIQQEELSKKRNDLINELSSNLTPAQILYSTVDELENLKENNNSKTNIDNLTFKTKDDDKKIYKNGNQYFIKDKKDEEDKEELTPAEILYGKVEDKNSEDTNINADIDKRKDINNNDKWEKPVNYMRVSSPYSPNRYHPVEHKYKKHDGVDLAVKQGSNIQIPASGIVEFAGEQKGYGYVVVINHGKINGKTVKTKYAHLSKINVRKGENIKKGGSIGLSGGQRGTKGAGTSTGPHLHFEVHENGIPQNPMRYLKN